MKRATLLAAVTSAWALVGCATNMDGNGMTATGGTAARVQSVNVGGQPMFANRTIADNAVNAPNLSQVVSLLQRANLVATLRGDGPFTVLAPNNDAFTRVPAATMSRLGADTELLRRALTFHVLPGRYTRADLMNAIRRGGGTATFNTVNGATLRARMEGDFVVLEGENNSVAYLSQANVPASNGLVHVINGVLIPPALG